MRVMLTVATQMGPKGKVLDLSGGMARELIRWHRAIPAPGERPSIAARVAAAVMPKRKPGK